VDAAAPRATVTRWATKASDTNNAVTADILAFYVQDQVTLAPQWKAVLGLRQDRFKVTLDDRNAANLDLDRADSVLSPRAGLVFQPNAASSYYLSWSYAFLPSSETLSLSAANADLKPEKGLNWELGGKWDLGAGFAVTATAFRLDRADVKSRDPNDPTKLVLSGLQRTEGLELGVQGQLLPRWQVYAGYANLNARVLKATGGSATAAPVPVGTKVPLVPRSAVSWWNKVDLDRGWSLGFGLVHQGEVFASTTNAVRLAGFTRADLAVFWQAHPKARLALNVENLMDRRYHATAGSDFNILFGAPRSIALTCAMAF
jgi:catecholate siderophore receptor